MKKFISFITKTISLVTLLYSVSEKIIIAQ